MTARQVSASKRAFRAPRLPVLWLLLLLGGHAAADGFVVDRIYHPYVQPMEHTLEWRMVGQDEQPGVADNQQLHRLAYGQSISARWFAEVYLLGQKSIDQGLDVKGYELEALSQLTEQGEYWADWGVLLSLGKKAHGDIGEFSVSLLAEKEWGRWSGTANFSLSREWGSNLNEKWDRAISLQARYRYAPVFEPAVEFYGGQNTRGLGPVILGQARLGTGRWIKWEAGMIFGLDSVSPDDTLRLQLEFEF